MVDHIPPPPPPPPTPPPPGAPEAAYVEEYNEEAQAARPETRQSANISTKRSKPDVASPRAGRDEFSDSGHSSQTVATLGSSATSSIGSNGGPNLPKAVNNTAASKRRPTNVKRIGKSRSHSPEKPPLQKTQSISQKHKPCECTECVAKARRTSTLPETSKKQETRPKAKSKPLLGGLLRSSKPPPARVAQDVPMAPPPRPRTSTSQHHQSARPVSFHADVMPEPVFIPQQPYMLERQPIYAVPPIFSPPSYPPPQPSYFPQLQPVPPPQDFYATSYPAQSRPIPRQRNSGPPPRPQSMYYGSTHPIVDYGEQPILTTIAPGLRPPSRRPSHRERPKLSPDEYPAYTEDYYKTPQPLPKTNSKHVPEARPPMIRHAHTTSDAHPLSHHRSSEHKEGTRVRGSNQSPVKQSFTEHERSRRPEPRSAKRSDESITSPYGVERGAPRDQVEHNAVKQRRRASVYGHESLQDLEGSVEAYQALQGTPITSNPIPVDSLVRRKKTHASNSDTSSRQSGKSGKSRNSREGSDVKSRRPSSDIKNRSDNDGLAMRFKPTQGVNIEMKSGIEGRTISFRQSKDGEGDMELGIGSRGKPIGSRPPIAGREKSRRSYSYIDGQGVTEVERSRPSSRAPRGYSYLDGKGQGVTQIERVRTRSSAAESIEEEREPRVISERTTETIRTRRSSRSGYSVRG